MVARYLAIVLAAAPSAKDAHDFFRAVTILDSVTPSERVPIAVESCAELAPSR